MTENGRKTLVQVRGLWKNYAARDALMRRRAGVTALKDVNLEIGGAEIVALVGESGSGKSTLARCIAQLDQPDRGEIFFRGTNLSKLNIKDLRSFRSQMQLIFQDSAGALNPRFTAAEIVEEPLLIQKSGTPEERRLRALDLMQRVGLAADGAERRITQFSGGQRQRLAIARALIVRPTLLILDEALSGLDLSTQAQVLNLLLELQQGHGLTYLLISHDLALLSQVADRIVIMHEGQIVEWGKPTEIFARPQHPQTRALVNAASAMGEQVRAQAAGAR